jgi:hypothetical protein
VNPARSHRLDSRRKYRPRKITDIVTKQVLLLCNACGLSMVRSKKERHRKVCQYKKIYCSLVFVSSFTEQERTCKIRGVHGSDHEECHILGYKNPVCTSQETLLLHSKAQPVNAM